MEISKKFIDDINGCIWLEKCGEENVEKLDFPLQLIENLKDAENILSL